MRLCERGEYRNTVMSVLRWAMGECRRESRNVCTGELLPGRSSRWKGPLRVPGGGSAFGSGVDRENKGGSWVGSASGARLRNLQNWKRESASAILLSMPGICFNRMIKLLAAAT